MYNNANLKEDKYFHPVSVVPGPLAPSCAEGNGGNTTDIPQTPYIKYLMIYCWTDNFFLQTNA